MFSPKSIGSRALCGIVKEAHEKGLKVAAHATELATVRQAVDAGVFGIENISSIEPGKRSSLLVIDGRPDKNIKDITNIVSLIK